MREIKTPWMPPVESVPELEGDLYNELIAETFRPGTHLSKYLHADRNLRELRQSVNSARRYVLDDEMAAFMADLSTVPLQRVDRIRRPDVLDSLRHSAILPFPKTWVEFSNRAFRKRLLQIAESDRDIWGAHLLPHDGAIVPRLAWLIEEDKQNPSIIHITEFMDSIYDNKPAIVTPPFEWVYNLQDQDFPDRMQVDCRAGAFAHGITGHICKRIGVRYRNGIAGLDPAETVYVEDETSGTKELWATHFLVAELASVVRYVIAFLATLSDCPVEYSDVRVSRGYLAQGRIRKYLDHTAVRFTLPRKVSRKILALRLIAKARRGWHEVEAHWRTYQQGVGYVCPTKAEHEWPEHDEHGRAQCKKCNAKRVRIVLPNGRGDPTIAIRTHHYEVGHRERA